MKSSPVVESPSHKLASKNWDEFKYHRRGKDSDNPLLQFEDEKPGSSTPEEELQPNNNQTTDITRIKAWAGTVPDLESQAGPFFIPPTPLNETPTPPPASSRKCCYTLG